MQLEGLTIALRARTPWEATDLGIALVRAHAARIYAAWVLTTLPMFLLLNVLGWLINEPWLAALAFWWLKPVFDRIPMYVISRAVFGTEPSLRETMAAQNKWAWRGIAPWLLWRRLHPGRAMLLPVDLLEGETGGRRSERVRVLTRANASPNMMLTIIGVHLEFMLTASIVLLGLMFVPVEFLSDSAKAVWHGLIEDPPLWAKVGMNLIGWIAMTIVEPFYVGAGFGLYLNRRMQLEGWDIELAFRRLAARLAQPLVAAALLLVSVLVFSTASSASEPSAHGDAQAGTETSKQPTDSLPESLAKELAHSDAKASKDRDIDTTLQKMFADSYRNDGAAFEQAVKKAYGEVDLSPKVREFVWERRIPLEADSTKPSDLPWWARSIGQTLGFVAQYWLWIMLAIGLIAVIANHRRWLPWISDRFAPERTPDSIGVLDVTTPDRLPEDVPTAVRALWQRGSTRAALALLYRAGVERLAESLGTPLPPGATESDCLRQSRRLRDTRYATLFARIVRSWQAAAYAQRLPLAAEVESMLVDWSAPLETPP